jgi:hypothetical protein
MNVSVPQKAEERVLHSACANAGSQASGIRPFYFGMAARHKCLEPGRYLILMREYYGNGNWRRPGRFRLLAGS